MVEELEKELGGMEEHFSKVFGQEHASQVSEALAFGQKISEEDSIQELEKITQDLDGIKGMVSEYLTRALTWKEQLNISGKVNEWNPLQRVLQQVKAMVGLREGFQSMPLSEQLNFLFYDFEKYAGALSGIRDEAADKVQSADKYVTQLRSQIKEAVPMMRQAEKEVTEVQAEREALEAKLSQELSIEDKVQLQEDHDTLMATWDAADQRLRDTTYTYLLSQNLVDAIRAYRQNLKILAKEADKMLYDLNLTTNSLRPFMGTVVSGARIAEVLTNTLESYKVLRDTLNPVLMRTADIGAIMQTAREKTMDGTVVNQETIDHLKETALRAEVLGNARTIERLLQEHGIKVEGLGGDEPYTPPPPES